MADRDAEHDITASNPLFGEFQQTGQNRGAHGIVAGVGTAIVINGDKAAGFGYQYANRENGSEHSLRANFTWNF